MQTILQSPPRGDRPHKLVTIIPYTLVPIAGFFLFEASGLPGGDWGSLGVGGALATLMFWFYRVDRKDSEKQRDETNETLVKAIDRNSNALEKHAAGVAGLQALMESNDRRMSNRQITTSGT